MVIISKGTADFSGSLIQHTREGVPSSSLTLTDVALFCCARTAASTAFTQSRCNNNNNNNNNNNKNRSAYPAHTRNGATTACSCHACNNCEGISARALQCTDSPYVGCKKKTRTIECNSDTIVHIAQSQRAGEDGVKGRNRWHACVLCIPLSTATHAVSATPGNH